eukprot:1051112-Rhodomonas_salina.1
MQADACHWEQAPEPFTALYVPIAHAEHAAPSEPSNPTLQMQSVMSSLPLRECVLEGQGWHVDCEVAATAVE